MWVRQLTNIACFEIKKLYRPKKNAAAKKQKKITLPYSLGHHYRLYLICAHEEADCVRCGLSPSKLVNTTTRHLALSRLTPVPITQPI
jgi:hypothetical protein